MDIVRAWVLGAAGFLALDMLLGQLLPFGTLTPLYFICPFLAGLIAASVHLWKGEGGWVRHAIAVCGAPILLSVYYALFTPWNLSSGPVMDIMTTLLFVVAAVAGAAIVHTTHRFVLVER